MGRLSSDSVRKLERIRQTSSSQIMVTSVGLQMPERIAFDTWERAGIKIAGIADSAAWCLGDWLVYGQEKYSDRYRRAIKAANLDYQTLRNYAWVTRRFDISRRRPRLSFQHHAEVAALSTEEQDSWLDLAEEHSWSRNELRRRIRARKSLRSQELMEARPLPSLKVSPERIDRWREAAECMNVELERWIVTMLDTSASQVLAGSEPVNVAVETEGIPVPAQH